jgi:hypothetical protein
MSINQLNAALVSAVAGVLFALAGCSANTTSPTGGSHDVSPGGIAQQSGMPVMPAADARAEQSAAQRTSSGVLALELLGDQYADKSDNATADEAAHTLQLAAISRAVSWGVYGFNGMGQADLPRTLTVDLSGAAPPVLWIGLADYSKQRWEWHSIQPVEGVAQIGFANGGHYINQAGTFYTLLAVSDGAAATIAELQLACEQLGTTGVTQWPMFGHDAQHTFRTSAVMPDSPQLKWSLDLGKGIWHGLAVSDSGLIYAASGSGELITVKPTGEVLWTFPIGAYALSTPAVASDGAAFIGSWDRCFYAVNANGSLRWKINTGGMVLSSAVIAPDGIVYFCAGNGLYACDQQTGVKWFFNEPTSSVGSPAVAQDGTVYFSGIYLWAVNPDGTLKWRGPDPVAAESSVGIGPDGTVYCGNSYMESWDDTENPQHEFYALSAGGELRWSLDFAATDLAIPAIAEDGTLYLGASSFNAIKPDGSTLWSYNDAAYDWFSNGYAIDGNGTVISQPGAPNWPDQGSLQAFSTAGVPTWSHAGPAGFDQAVIAAGGVMYITDKDGILYAFGPQ